MAAFARSRTGARLWTLTALGCVACALTLPAEDRPARSSVETDAVESTTLALEFLGETIELGRRVRLPQAKRSYGPEQAAGEPDTPGAGDSGTSWASSPADGTEEWLVCRYAEPLMLRSVIVHENYNPGALTKVTVFNAAGEAEVAWQGEDPVPRGRPRGIAVIPVKVNYPVSKIKLTIDSAAVPGWNEIDAVGVTDAAGATHWAVEVTASSTYATGGSSSTASGKRTYSPEQATGEPDTVMPGDQSSAWASATSDGSDEWLECEFETAQQPASIAVYENNAPGAIHKVTVLSPEGKEVVVHEGADPTPREQAWGVSVFPVDTKFPFKKVKLYLKSREVAGYNEIDAVGLRSEGGDTQWAVAATASSAYGVSQPQPLVPAPVAQTEPAAMMSQDEVVKLRKDIDALKKQLEEIKTLLKSKPAE